jgi:hypothetical protein
VGARKLLNDMGHALRTFLDLDDEGEVVAWERTAVFRLDRPEKAIWAELPCAESPPKAWLLMTRLVEGEPVHELLWAAGGPEDTWPVVEVSASGDAQVVASNAEDWIDALLYTGGRLGGGNEEDLEAARKEASIAALQLADELADELDRDVPNLEELGERCEAALEKFEDPWYEAVEGLD